MWSREASNDFGVLLRLGDERLIERYNIIAILAIIIAEWGMGERWMPRKLVVEAEIPEGVDVELIRREIERQLARIVLLQSLESLQTKAPPPRVIEELARQVKVKAYGREEK